jgi:regulatory protein
MSKITGLKQGKTRAKRINVYVDEKYALSLTPETAKKENLTPGQEIGQNALEELAAKDRRQQCFNAAVRFLGYRPRSEAETRQRLSRYGFESDVIEKTLERLKEAGFTDDDAFARLWVENRDALRPRSKSMTKMELKRKGLEADIIEKAISTIDEKDNAYRAAQNRARRLEGLDHVAFRLRMGQYLGRRGFNYAIIKEITQQVWKEMRKK